jgi:ornithine--oxo-acid transaminase
VREICDRHNVLLIADEIQSRLGRCGQWFACDWENVTPDMITIGKALSGGMLPVSAVVGNSEGMGLFEPGSHGSTFGGSSLACAVARESLKVLADERLPERARELGVFFRNGLREIQSPYVKEIRGKGLLIGVELEEEAGPARPFVRQLQARRVLAKETHGAVIRFSPPLIIRKEEIDFILEQVREVLLPPA